MTEENFTCKRDNLTIRGLLYCPEDFDKSKKFPLAIVSHGFMGHYSDTQDYAKNFAKMGFVSIAYDFNGGGPNSVSDGDTKEMSLLTEKEDLKAVIKRACEFDFVDTDNINLIGCSMGGFVSALVARELQEKIKRLILFYPAFCIPDDARSGKMISALFDPKNIPQTLEIGKMVIGSKYVKDVINLDAFEEIRDYKGQILILHGNEDEIVPYNYSERAYQAYFNNRGNKPSKNLQLVMIDKANHGFWGPQSNDWNKYAFFAIEKFLQGKELLLNVDVNICDCKKSQEDNKSVTKLYFKGKVQSPYFEGQIIEPAYDKQLHKGEQLISACARYKVEGKDYTGKKASFEITNQLSGSGKNTDWNLDWKPSIKTDSLALKDFNSKTCQTYAEMRPQGPVVHIWG
ncbi:MAG: alpha/beta hydrolase [Treponema sp.]|nr:alpha/beta hydrolase [Treponema sp.]